MHRFGVKPKLFAQSLLESGHYPELDVFEFIDKDGIKIYQSVFNMFNAIDRFDW